MAVDTDRRIAPRAKTTLHVKYRSPNGCECSSLSRIVNVSQGGLQIVCHEPVKVHTVLEMSIGGTHDSIPVSFAGEVMWINPVPGSDGAFYSGVRFKDLGEDARALILGHFE